MQIDHFANFPLRRPFRVDGFYDLWNQFGAHDHDGQPLGAIGMFVFGSVFVVDLVAVAVSKLADSFFIPSGGAYLPG